jgi:hypothetical protein
VDGHDNTSGRYAFVRLLGDVHDQRSRVGYRKVASRLRAATGDRSVVDHSNPRQLG